MHKIKNLITKSGIAMKKIISFLLVLLLTINLVACKKYADKDFQTKFISATQERWTEIENSYENTNSDKSFYYEKSKILGKEIDALSPFKDKEFQDENLKKITLEYLSLITEEKKLSDLGFNDKLKAKDEEFQNLLWMKRVEIYRTLHDKYKFSLNKKQYNEIIEEYNKYLKTNKERSTILTDEQKKEYSNDVSFDSLIENEEKLLDKKIILNGKVGAVHMDASDLYFLFNINGDYDKSMFVFYKKDILSRNIKEGDNITCYIDYMGLTGANTTNDTVVQIPNGWARFIGFK